MERLPLNDLETQSEGQVQQLNGTVSAGTPWKWPFAASCCLNILLTVAVGYLLWSAIFTSTSVDCQQDFLKNLRTVRRNVSAVVAEHALDTASQGKIDCFLAKYKTITFELANYSDTPFIFQWKMQLGTPQQMREVFEERRHMMADENFTQLYDLLNADGMWAYLYSRYYPKEVQEKLMQSDMRETAMMVTMVKMPECINGLVDAYAYDNYEKYFYYTRYPSNTLKMNKASEQECDSDHESSHTRL